jgi:hypothetical protein
MTKLPAKKTSFPSPIDFYADKPRLTQINPAFLPALPCLSACLSARLTACLPSCLPFLLYSKYSTYVLYLPVCLPVCLSVCPSVCLSVCLSACLPAGPPACKKIWSKIAKIKKLVTRTPVSTKRTNRVASKNHTSGIEKNFFLSDLISRGLMGNILKNQTKFRKKNSQYLLG